ncbi:hypothetical protein F5Y02DRAFT_168760 [Annulohypoxylon stygium]|nr:hypothetical protein F5Y02DRAFT_168760 [Annulohypoxylon stygium]
MKKGRRTNGPGVSVARTVPYRQFRQYISFVFVVKIVFSLHPGFLSAARASFVCNLLPSSPLVRAKKPKDRIGSFEMDGETVSEYGALLLLLTFFSCIILFFIIFYKQFYFFFLVVIDGGEGRGEEKCDVVAIPNSAD